MNEWYIFKGSNEPSDRKIEFPEAPKWRRFTTYWDELRGMTFEAGEEEKRMINAALYLRRPLLITGNPGTGKSSLAYAVAYELRLGKVLDWPITTRTTLQEGLYRYDAIGRLQDIQIERLKNPKGRIEPPDIGRYIRLGPLGTAFLPSNRPRVLLIDEIDKSDIDLPNDLLNIFEEGRFEIPELIRFSENKEKADVYSHDGWDKTTITGGRVICKEFPLVILTSNGERELPAPFLRRCLRLEIADPGLDKLKRIVERHFGDDIECLESRNKLIKTFFEMRQKGSMATDQLLNAVYLIGKGIDLSADNKDINRLREAIFKYLSTMGTI